VIVHNALVDVSVTASSLVHVSGPCCCRIRLYGNRVGGGVAPPPLTPPDMRARIRRFVKPFGRDAARSG
jgi:hypothetical protein